LHPIAPPGCLSDAALPPRRWRRCTMLKKPEKKPTRRRPSARKPEEPVTKQEPVESAVERIEHINGEARAAWHRRNAYVHLAIIEGRNPTLALGPPAANEGLLSRPASSWISRERR
jgi:hypothetical protein